MTQQQQSSALPQVRVGSSDARERFEKSSEQLYVGTTELAPAPSEAENDRAPTTKPAPKSDVKADADVDPFVSRIVPKDDTAVESDAGEPDDTAVEIDAINEPDGISAKGREGWKALKDKTHGLNTENKTLKSRIAELEQRSSDPDASALREQNAELRKRLDALDYQASDDYKAKFERPRQIAIERMKRLLAGTDVNVDDLMRMPDDARDIKLDAIAEGLPRAKAQRLINEFVAIDELEQQRRSALTSAEDNVAKMREERRQQVKQLTARDEQTFNAEFGKFSGNGGSLFERFDESKLDGDSLVFARKYNEGLDAIKESARDLLFKESDTNRLSTGAIKAGAFDFLAGIVLPETGRRLAAAMKTIAGLRAEVNSFKATKPASHASRDGSPSTPSAAKTPEQRRAEFERNIAGIYNE